MTKGEYTQKQLQGLKIKYGICLGLGIKAREEAGLPITQKDFAEQYHITEETLCRWKRRDPMVVAARKNAAELFWGEIRLKVINNLKTQALLPNAKWQVIKLFLDETRSEDDKKASKEIKEPIEVKFIFEQPGSTDKTQLAGAVEISGEPN